MYVSSADVMRISISGGSYDSKTLIRPGMLFYISNSSPTLKTYVTISNSPTFSEVNAKTTTVNNVATIGSSGCVFYLTNVVLTDSGGTTYSDIQCDSGGIFYLTQSSININDATFESIQAPGGNGGVVYADSSTYSSYSFNDC